MIRRLHPTGPLLFVCALALAFAPDSVGAQPSGSQPHASPATEAVSPPAWPDSLEEFVPGTAPADWDSVLAAYDVSVGREREHRLLPRYGLRYNKAEGVHAEAGVNLVVRRLHLSSLDLRVGYDLGRSRPNAVGRLQVGLGSGERWFLEATGWDDAHPFGQHQPYGNTWFALFGGYDAMQYLREREFGAFVSWKASEERQAWFGCVRTQHDPLPVAADWRVFGSDRWMSWNASADRIVANGLQLRLRRAPAYAGETVPQGLVSQTSVTVCGGELLGGSREFSVMQSDLWSTHLVNRGDWIHLRSSASLATGRAPFQVWPELGGDAGLRAFPPRGYGTADTLVGHARLLARVEFRSRGLSLKRSRLPVLRDLGLRAVPFVEAGAVWGREAGADSVATGEPPRPRVRSILEPGDLQMPRRSDVRWDLGFGLRKDIDYAGLLSYAQIDFAWPMGADTGPVRITVQFSKDGLD